MFAWCDELCGYILLSQNMLTAHSRVCSLQCKATACKLGLLACCVTTTAFVFVTNNVCVVCDRLSAELQEKERLIQALQKQLQLRVPTMHHFSDSEMSDRLSSDVTSSFHGSPPALRRQTPSRNHTGIAD